MSGTAPLIVTALFGGADFAFFDTLRRAHYPAQRNLVPAHCTLFHHIAPGLAAELKQRLAAETRGVAPPRAEIGGVIAMGHGTGLRIESPGLEEIRDRLAEAFHGMLLPQDQAGWRPHVTIQNKVEPHEAKALTAQMRAEFVPRPLAIAGLASWWYRGGPWEAHSRHMFA